MLFIGRTILSILILPLLLTIDVFKSKKSVIKKIGFIILVLIFFSFTWVLGYRNLFGAVRMTLYELGLSDKLTSVTVSGTSMLPTISDGEKITLHNPQKLKIERGDIVTFSNFETGISNYVKRVIGLGGESISIEEGVVSINNIPLEESYIYQKNPTYGNTFLLECTNYVIPKGKIAVLGDNRIASTDSRVIGFIDEKDINGVIKTNTPPKFSNATKKIPYKDKQLDNNLFISNLNEKRRTYNSGNLQPNSILMEVAKQRSIAISKNIDNWKSIENNTEQLLNTSGYDYFLIQEVVTFGNYDASQLAEHVLELRPYNNDFLSSNYYDLGIATSVGSKGICSIPINVIILAWPTTPSYSQEILDIWQADVDKLEALIRAIGVLKINPSIDVQETQQIITELNKLLDQASQLQNIMLQGQWLTESEDKLLGDYLNNTNETQLNLANYIRKHEKQISDDDLLSLLSDYKWGNADFNKEVGNAKQYWSQGKYQDQLQSAQKAKELSQNDEELAIGYYWEGLASYNLNNMALAKQSLNKAVALNEYYAGPYVTLSAIAFTEGNYQLGFEYATKCVELDPNYGWCHNNLGISYNYLGNREKAIEELERAVSLDRENYVFNNNLKRVKEAI